MNGGKAYGKPNASEQYIAAYEGRSMSRQVLHLIAACIRAFEKEHGPIDLEDKP